MKYLLCLLSIFCFAQTKPIIETTFLYETPITENSLISIDNFKTSYFLKGNSLVKETADDTLNYSNIQLGDISTANTFNPLKINLFYKDFNKVFRISLPEETVPFGYITKTYNNWNYLIIKPIKQEFLLYRF